MEALSMADSTNGGNRLTNEEENVDQPIETPPNEAANVSSDATAENPFAKKKRKKTSLVWNEFKEVKLPDGTLKAECVHCKTRLGFNKTGATTQYSRHLKICTRRLIALKDLQCLFNEYIELHKAKDIERNPDCVTAPSSSQARGEGFDKGRARGRNKFDKYIRNVDSVWMAKTELDGYLDDGVVLHNDAVDPPFDALKWWQENSNKYRILSRMACDILSIPITNVASESAFSAGGRIIDPHRASLGTDTVQFLTCGADWIRALHGIKRKEKVGGKEIDVIEFSLS